MGESARRDDGNPEIDRTNYDDDGISLPLSREQRAVLWALKAANPSGLPRAKLIEAIQHQLELTRETAGFAIELTIEDGLAFWKEAGFGERRVAITKAGREALA